MKKVIVNIENETVICFNEISQNWETCNFIEAGLYINSDGEFSKITEPTEIIEFFAEREDENVEVIIEDAEAFINGNIVTDSDNTEWLMSTTGEMMFLGNNGIYRELEENEVEMNVPDTTGGRTRKMCKVLANKECTNPVQLSDLTYKNGFWSTK